MNYFKCHEYTAIIMLIAAILCIWSGHKMTAGHKA